mmetsp:Transcript_14506/g.16479  ORF Transcript_14506/g.16479 Transcript_14506/m.16479 type:complete len:257 (+) Transcript_14506:146-916(+)
MVMKIVAFHVVLLSATVSVQVPQLLGVGAFTAGIAVGSQTGHTTNTNSNSNKCRGTTKVSASDSEFDSASVNNNINNNNRREWLRQQGAVAFSLSSLLFTASTPQSAQAADKKKKGKGKVVDISNQDLSGQELSQQDFKAVVATGTNFTEANLQGAQFQGANLVGAIFVGDDLRGANFEDAVLDKATFANANAVEARFCSTILDAGNLENIDLTKSIWPSRYRTMICDMEELKGVNPTTGVDTRGSIQCNDRPYSG